MVEVHKYPEKFIEPHVSEPDVSMECSAFGACGEEQ